jgi:hypothetical protein
VNAFVTDIRRKVTIRLTVGIILVVLLEVVKWRKYFRPPFCDEEMYTSNNFYWCKLIVKR